MALAKCASGIAGFDEITGGGFPRGRTALVCGSAGCGKTQLAMEFIARGARDYHEPGVFMSFEENEEELKSNVRSLGFDLDDLIERKLLAMDYVAVERSEIEETGEYDLEGLFVRLQHAISSVGAKRVALDTIEALFSGLANQAILRAELRRLFRWLKVQGVTTLITGERGDGTFTRQGIEEYVSDCVITLDHRVTDQLSTRRLRIVKYRGSTHGTNEYPFLITHTGISVLPITSLSLNHAVSNERVSTGVPRLDTMLGGQGYYRGTTILLTGTAGTGKTSLSATFVDAACRRGEKCLYLAFEESQDQIIRNMRSIGVDLQPHVNKGLLKFHASRPTFYGLEMHLLVTHLLVEQQRPAIVVIDPVTNLVAGGSVGDVHAMAMRLVDYLKGRGITTVMTTLTSGGNNSGANRDQHFVAHRHLVAGTRYRERRRTQPGPLCAEKPRHGTLEPNSGVSSHQSWGGTPGRVPGSGRSADGFGAAGSRGKGPVGRSRAAGRCPAAVFGGRGRT